MAPPDSPPPLLEPVAGRLLVSNPHMMDPNFMHTVVFLCDHDALGTYGVVLNRHAGKGVNDLGSSVQLLTDRDDPVWIGGPVAADTLQVVHRLVEPIEGSQPIVPGLYLGGEPDALDAALCRVSDPKSHIRFVLGYSGWSAGQLQAEMAEGAWVVCNATPDFVFDHDPDTLWRRVLRARGGPFAGLADLPPDPSWN
jgi:putative transcriptional regulator